MILYSSIHPSIHASILSAKMCSAYDRNDSLNLKAKKKKKKTVQTEELLHLAI